MQYKKPLIRLLRPHFAWLLLAVLLSILSVAAQLSWPVLIGDAIDCIAPGATDFEALWRFLSLGIALIAGGGVLQWCISLIYNRICFTMVQTLRKNAYDKLQTLPVSYLDAHAVGDILSRVIADADQFSDGLLMGFHQLFSGILTVLGTVLFMLRIKVEIALIVIVLTPLSILLARFITKRTHSMFRLQSKLRGEQVAYVEEMLGGLMTLKAFSREEQACEAFDKQNNAFADASLHAVFFSSLTNPSTRFLNNIIYAVVAMTGAFYAIGGGLSIGSLSCFLSYATQYAKPFNEISGVLAELQNAFVCAGRIFELLEQPDRVPDTKSPVRRESTEGAVCFCDVYFSYTPQRPLIRNFNVSVKPGQTVAIVGPTGCGKTTLINLLLRFYDPQSGKITLDGVDLRDYTRHDLRKKWGMVLQDTWFAESTVAENIAFGRPQATRDEIISAAKAAHAHSFIRRLPQGYDTLLKEGSAGLSEGQKQLLSIARVMLAAPPLLILDEATSSIDTHTERRIQQAFSAMMQGRTCFIVAHRLSTIKNADLILAMKDGNVVEMGNHKSLLEKGGFYAQLYNSQFEKAE